MSIVMLPPYAMLAGSMGAAMGGTLPAAYDPSPFGLDALTSKYGIYSPAYRVLTSYDPSGNLLRLRRSTDDAEADFGAVRTTGLLDTAAVTSWLGGGTGYCTTLYDQSGNGYNASQATAGNQPALDLSGSIPCLDFDGTNDVLDAPGAGAVFRNVGQGSMLAVCKYDSAAITDSVMGVSTGGAPARLVLQKTTTAFRAAGRRLDADGVSNTTGITGSLNWVVQIIGADWANSNAYHRVDATEETKTDFLTDGSTEDTSSTYVYLGAQPITNWIDGKATLFVLTRDLLSGTTGGNLATSLAALKVT